MRLDRRRAPAGGAPVPIFLTRFNDPKHRRMGVVSYWILALCLAILLGVVWEEMW